MAGHSKFANIKHRKARVDAKRSATFSKHAKLIMTAAKIGGRVDNPRLNLAMDKARADNMPKDKIERAILKGTGELAGENLSEVRYEGYGPGGVAIIVDAITDNRNRTAPEMRKMFEKGGGNMGESGSVAWMFDSRASVTLNREGVDEDELTEALLEVGGDDLVTEDEQFQVLGEPSELHNILTGLTERGYSAESAEIIMVPKNLVEVDKETAEKILNLMETFEAYDDVSSTYANFDIPDDVLKELASEQS